MLNVRLCKGTSPNVLHFILLAWDKITITSSVTQNQWLWTERRTLMRCIERFNIVHRLVIAWKNSRHFRTPPLVPLRNERRNSILMMYQYLALGIDASSVSSFCAHFSDVILRRNQWWHREMSAVQFDLLPFLPAQQPLWQVQSFAPRGEELVILHNSTAGKRGQQMWQTWQGHYFHVLS